MDPTGHIPVESVHSRYDGSNGIYCGVNKNPFDSDTYATTTTETYADGYLYSTETRTLGFSEWNFRLNSTAKSANAGNGWVGAFGKIGMWQFKNDRGIDFSGQGGDGDFTLSRYDVLDLLVLF